MVVLIKRATSLAISAAFVLGGTISLSAQAHRLFALAELVDSAKHYYPTLLQKDALVRSARAGITEAKHAFLPKFSLTDEVLASSANSLPGTVFPLGTIPSISGSINPENNGQAASGNLASVYAEYELLNFGLKQARTGSATALADVQQADFNRELYVMSWEIGRLYFTLLKNEYQLDIDARNIARYDSIFQVIRALTSSGINAGVDSSLARAELSRTRINFNNRQAEVTRLQQQLSFYTGIRDAVSIDTTEAKYLSYRASVSAGRDTTLNPLTDYYLKQESFYKSNENLVKKQFLPKVWISAGGWARGSSIEYNGQYKDFGTGFGYQRFNYGVALAFTYDLFNGVRKKDRLTVSQWQTSAAAFGTEQQRDALRAAAQQAATSVHAAENNLLELPVQVGAANDAFNQKMAQYKAGLVNLVDLTNASFLLYTAQSAYVQTLNDWYLASLDKAAAEGNLDFFIQSIKK